MANDTKVPLLATDPAQDRILDEFLAKDKHKAAIDNIDKRLKKARKEHVTRLSVMRILITIQRDRLLSYQHDPSSYLLTMIDELVELGPQIASDEACLEAVDEIGRGNWIGQFWQKAGEAHSTHEEIFEIWFDTQFRKGQYDEAARAIVSWRKHFPARAPELLWRLILCYHLASGSHHISEQQQKMSGMLRDRLIEQAVDNTPSTNAKLPTLRTQLDLELVCSVCMDSGKGERALAILNDDTKGLRSSLGNSTLAKLKAEILYQSNNDAELRLYIRQILEDAVSCSQDVRKQHWGFGEAGDNGSIITLLVDSTNNENHKQSLELLKSLAESGSLNGHLGLAILRCRFTADQALDTAKDFWVRYAPLGKAIEFRVHEELLPHQRGAFLEFVLGFANDKGESTRGTDGAASHETQFSHSAINSIVQAYDLALIWAKHDHGVDASKLVSFACALLPLWKITVQSDLNKAAAENGAGDEALILAARINLHLYFDAPERFPDGLSCARLILEILIQFSRHNFRALILLVRIYMYQGAATKAIYYYRRLDVKNLQFITETASMIRGLSMLYPESAPRQAQHPLVLFRSMQQWVDKRGKSYDNFVVEGIEEGNWPSVINQLRMKEEIFNSPTAAMIAMELYNLSKNRAAVDASLVAAADASMLRIARTMKTKNASGGGLLFSPGDRLAAEYPHDTFHESLQLTKSEAFLTSFWSAILTNETRRIIRRLPERQAERLDTKSASQITTTIWTLVTAVATRSTKAANMPGIFATVGYWLDKAARATPGAAKTDEIMPAGLEIVHARATLDILWLLREVLVWMRQEPAGTQYKAELDETEQKIRACLLPLRQVSTKVVDAVRKEEDGKSIMASDIGQAIVGIIGTEDLQSACKEYADSVRAAVSGL